MEQRNLILAIVISVAILLGYELLVGGPMRESLAPQQTGGETTAPGGDAAGQPGDSPGVGAPGAPAPAAGGGAAPAVPGQTRAAALEGARVRIDTPALTGSIALTGGRLDDLVLRQYRQTVDPQSPEIVLLSPAGAPRPYYADFGWSTTLGIPLPGPETRWQADGTVLTPDNPVTLSWDNGEGLVFERRFAVDADYMFTVTQSVVNRGASSVSLAPYGLVSRTGTPQTLGYFILHEGLIGVLDDKLEEIKYSDVQDSGTISRTSTGGWLGITDKYWMATLVPDQSETVSTRFVYSGTGGVDKYQVDYLQEAVTVPAGSSASSTNRVFAGAKQVLLLDRYEEQYGIPKFDLAVDFGWFYFLTKPIFLALHWLQAQIGNFGVAILILTVGIKLLFFPLANKSYQAMAKMRRLQPEMVKLRERFGDDKQRMNQELMALYKKEGANPVAGCLPIIIQIPVFFALYKVLFVTIEMRHAPFFGWIQDLSAKDPTSIINLFGLLPYDVPNLGPLEVLSIGVLPLIMGLTMFLQQKLNPQPADPMQARIFAFMPIIFTFLLAQFPAGLVIYWTWNNTLSIIQQAVIMKRAGVPLGSGKASASPSNPKAGTRAAGKGEKAEGKDEGESKGEAKAQAQPKAQPKAGAAPKAANDGKAKPRRKKKAPAGE